MESTKRWIGIVVSLAVACTGCAAAAPEAASPAKTAHPRRNAPVLASSRAELEADSAELAGSPADDTATGSRAAKEEPAAKAPSPQPGPAAAPGGAAAPAGAGTPSGGAAGAPAGPSFAAQAPHGADLIVYTARVTMAVHQVEPGLDAVERVAREVGGYLAQRTDAEITIRVPRARFDEALRRVQQSGDVVHRDVSAEDVTDQYVEIETRLRNARAIRDRLEQLLARASVKEAVEIEKELGRVTGDIEAMEGKLKVLKDKIAYSTITAAFEARGAGAVRDVPQRLPFPWLSDLGLPRLLNLGEGER